MIALKPGRYVLYNHTSIHLGLCQVARISPQTLYYTVAGGERRIPRSAVLGVFHDYASASAAREAIRKAVDDAVESGAPPLIAGKRALDQKLAEQQE